MKKLIFSFLLLILLTSGIAETRNYDFWLSNASTDSSGVFLYKLKVKFSPSDEPGSKSYIVWHKKNVISTFTQLGTISADSVVFNVSEGHFYVRVQERRQTIVGGYPKIITTPFDEAITKSIVIDIPIPDIASENNKYLQVKSDATGVEWDAVSAITDTIVAFGDSLALYGIHKPASSDSVITTKGVMALDGRGITIFEDGGLGITIADGTGAITVDSTIDGVDLEAHAGNDSTVHLPSITSKSEFFLKVAADESKVEWIEGSVEAHDIDGAAHTGYPLTVDHGGTNNTAAGYDSYYPLYYNSSSGKIESAADSLIIPGLSLGSDVSIQGWQTNTAFASVDSNTVSWTASTLYLTDGTYYNIHAGSTGDMSALTYIYFSIADDDTLLHTTTAGNAVGRGKILVAVAQNKDAAGVNEDRAVFQVFGGSGGNTIMVDNIVANQFAANEIISNTLQVHDGSITNADIDSLSADKIYAGTIDASYIDVTNLNADNIVAGTLTGRRVQTAASGQRAVLDASSNTFKFFNSDGDSIVSIDGDATGYLRVGDYATNGLVTQILPQKVTVYTTVDYTPAFRAIIENDVNDVYFEGAYDHYDKISEFKVIKGGNIWTAGTVTSYGDSIIGNIKVTGTVDGIDISAHAGDDSTKHLPSLTGNSEKILRVATDESKTEWVSSSLSAHDINGASHTGFPVSIAHGGTNNTTFPSGFEFLWYNSSTGVITESAYDQNDFASTTNFNSHTGNVNIHFLKANIDTTGIITFGTWRGTAVQVLYGGTGQTSYTNGQLLIGQNTGNTLVKGTLTSGNGVNVINGSGSITLYLDKSDIDSVGTIAEGTWHGSKIIYTYLNTGIGDTKILRVDHISPVLYDYARFTNNGLEGRSYSEVKTDLSLNNVDNTSLASWAGTTNITTLGTITTGTWSAGTIALNKGGTGQTTKTAAFDALAPATTSGDMIYYNSSGDNVRLGIGTSSQVLIGGSAPTWASVPSHNQAWSTITSTPTTLAGYGINDASGILTAIKTVDGAGSGLDADLLDGNSSAYFAAAFSGLTGSYTVLTGPFQNPMGKLSFYTRTFTFTNGVLTSTSTSTVDTSPAMTMP